MNLLLQILLGKCNCESCKNGQPCQKVRRVWGKLKNPPTDVNDKRLKRWHHEKSKNN